MPIIAIDEPLVAFSREAIYLVHGSETLLSIEACDKIRSAMQAKSSSERQVIEADSHLDGFALEKHLGQSSLFSKHQLFEIQGLSGKPSAKHIEALEKLGNIALENTSVLLIFSEAIDRAHQQSNWFNQLLKKSTHY